MRFSTSIWILYCSSVQRHTLQTSTRAVTMLSSRFFAVFCRLQQLQSHLFVPLLHVQGAGRVPCPARSDERARGQIQQIVDPVPAVSRQFAPGCVVLESGEGEPQGRLELLHCVLYVPPSNAHNFT